jgi:sulfur carrier protein ThiS
MVKVIFYNLLRSKYNINDMAVESGTISEIIDQILDRKKEMKDTDFETAVVFYNGEAIHKNGFNQVINDDEQIIITHFVGGG